jgi:hypothetical protein
MTYFNITANYFSSEMKFKLDESSGSFGLYAAYKSARAFAARGFRTSPDDPRLTVIVEELPGILEGRVAK